MINEIYNEDALELVASLIEPSSKIFSDTEVAKAVRANNYMEAVKLITTKYKKETIVILATINGQKPEEYRANIFEMIRQLLTVLNTPELTEFFSWQGQKMDVIRSGSATENTEETEKV